MPSLPVELKLVQPYRVADFPTAVLARIIFETGLLGLRPCSIKLTVQPCKSILVVFRSFAISTYSITFISGRQQQFCFPSPE